MKTKTAADRVIKVRCNNCGEEYNKYYHKACPYCSGTQINPL